MTRERGVYGTAATDGSWHVRSGHVFILEKDFYSLSTFLSFFNF